MELYQKPDDTRSLFDLEGRDKNIVLQTTTLLNGLLTKGFTNKPGDIARLQQSDLLIRDIFDLVQQNKTKKFVLINKILYRKVNDEFFILVVPEVLGKEIITQCHNALG